MERLRRELAKANMNWMRQHGWAVFGTLKFTNGEAISGSQADKLVRAFWQRLDAKYYGSLTRRQGVRTERAVFLQFGKTAQSRNRHYHFVANPPLPVEFCGLAEREWVGLDRWCYGRDSEISLMRCSEAGGVYAASEAFFDELREGSESFQPQLSHFAHEHSHVDRTKISSIVQRRLFQRAA